MLILSRQEKQSIVIDDKVTITVVEVSEGRVRLGIEAPKDIQIHRKEIYDKIREETVRASQGQVKIKELEKITSPKNKKNILKKG